MPRRIKPGFIWVPRVMSTKYSIEIDGVDITRDVISSEWTRSIVGGESGCKLLLIDSVGAYADNYVGGEVIELLLDFSDGTTSQWKGTIEKPKKKYGDAYTLELVGSHYQTDLLNITVTEDYSGTLTVDEILKELIDEYLTGFTYTNVETSTVTPTIKWDNKPFWDCVVDLCNLASFDCYVDSDKDFHFFARESQDITNDAIVWKDNMLEISDLGTDQVDLKNKIIVYGEDNNGLPIIYETYTGDGDKEKIIKDTSIKTYEQAKELGDVELNSQNDLSESGEIKSLILPDLFPGGMIWISNPIQRINGKYKLYSYTHYLPVQQTKVIISKEGTIPQLFKDRTKKELALQKITNPFKMKGSYNFTFDDESNFDQVLSSSVEVEDGALKITSGATGTFISNQRLTNIEVTSVHVKVVGEILSGAEIYVSTDGGDVYTKITLETEMSVSSGSYLRVKIILNNTSTRIDSLAALYK